MELAPAGVPLSFEVTFDSPGLPVAMSVYDDTGANPVLLLSPFAMAPVVGNTYRGKFTAQAAKSYIVLKAVYTDGTFTVLDPNYIQGSESVVAQNLTPPVQEIIGVTGCSDEFSPVNNPFTIFLGDKKTMYLSALEGGCMGGPLDLTQCTEISVLLPNADGSLKQYLLSSGEVVIAPPSVLGRFWVPLASADSLLFNPGVLQSLDVTFTILGEVVTCRFENALSIYQVR